MDDFLTVLLFGVIVAAFVALKLAIRHGGQSDEESDREYQELLRRPRLLPTEPAKPRLEAPTQAPREEGIVASVVRMGSVESKP